MATLKTKLLPHQERVVGKIQKQPGLVVAHGLGSGKTLSSIAAAVNIQPDHTHVLVPASLKSNYEKEIKKHVRGTPPIRIGSLQHAALKGEPPKADMLVVDEAHRGRNPQSKTYKLIEGAQAKKRLLLTASPTYNRPSDVASLVNMAAGERVLPMGPEFEKRFVSRPPKGLWGLMPWVKKRPGIKNDAELGKHLGKWVDYHKSGGGDFPSVNEEKHEVKMSPRQTKLHDAAWGQLSLISKLRLQRGLPPEKQDLSKINQFQSQARQVSGTEASFVKGVPAQTSPKVLKAVGLLDDAAKANPNHRALVYSNYLGTLGDYSKELEARKVPHAIFSGKEKMKDRKQMVKDYNAGKLKALLVSSAGGEGLDLKGTRQVQVLEPHWNVEKLKQVEGRAIRKGSHSHLPKKERNVTLQRFESYPRGGFFGKRRGVEQVLGDMAKNKELLNQELVGLMEKKSAAYYHGTRPSLVPKIMKEGLLPEMMGTGWEGDPDDRKRVSLTKNKEHAKAYSRLGAMRDAKGLGKLKAALGIGVPEPLEVRFPKGSEPKEVIPAEGHGGADESHAYERVPPGWIKQAFKLQGQQELVGLMEKSSAQSGGTWLFHGSPRENEGRIDKEGLLPGKDTKTFMLARKAGRFFGRRDIQKESVHLTNNPYYAAMYGQSSKDGKLRPDRKPLIYGVKINPGEKIIHKGKETAALNLGGAKARISGETYLHRGPIDPSRMQKMEIESVLDMVNREMQKKAMAHYRPPGQIKQAYKLQGHTDVQGIPIAIENKKGSVRRGTDSKGKKWETKMKAPYGYIKGTKGADGEEVDAFIGPDKGSTDAFVVHQHKPDGTGYDEDKVMLGYPNKAAAKAAYLSHYDDPKFLGPISRVSTERLKDLVESKKKLVKISQVSYRAFLDEVMRCGGSF